MSSMDAPKPMPGRASSDTDREAANGKTAKAWELIAADYIRDQVRRDNAQAKELQFDRWAYELIGIADGPNEERQTGFWGDTWKWLRSKLRRRKLGDKTEMAGTGGR
ncbi:MAG TPA: hypothetical protein VMW18_16170 [Candidatus Binatia bacterium]|nr:hypothetical protein [Candidatus Binatia bacterium]